MSKTDILKSNGTYNINSASVRAENFQHGIFFDPCDLIQVKYEMLRCVERKELSISEATKRYGFSRQTYYSLKAAVEEGGIMALIPQKTGPKNNFKLIEEGQLFIDAYLRKHSVCHAVVLVQFLHFRPDKASGHTPANSAHPSLPFYPVDLISY